jgi:hypothetical protein
MRLRVGAALCLFLAFWGSGCRKALAPTTVDNQPPETWIVAAPQDTITTRDASNTPIKPQIGKIPVRFHMYWAGSDRDGTVVGFYWAVVETLPVPPEGSSSVPALPGPKARDYHYTTATDSIFIFDASEEVSERQHAFYIYAVDDKGRPDPTPARFVFSAYDRFPPTAVIDECKATGIEYQLLPGGGVMPLQKTYIVTDFFEISNDHAFPRDTVTSNALLHMKWHGVPTIPSTVVTGYRYKLDEPNFNTVDSSVHETSYNTGVGTDKVNPGQKIFTLRAIGQSGWRGESTRWFQMNFAPDTWFAGANPNDPAGGWSTQAPPYGGKYKDFDLTGWGAFTGVPNSMLTQDSLKVLPALRTERKSFFEVYNNRLWIRQENDTVHLNSWVIMPAGGFDRDSPYAVKVNVALLDSAIRVQQFPVITPAVPNGSPIGFRIRVQVKDKAGQVSQPSETTTYPVFDPASVFHQPVINGYWGLTSAGKAYAVIRAEDGDGTVDRRIDQRPGDAVGVADRVDAGGGTTQDKALRSKVLTFYVNHAPLLQRTDPSFTPRNNQVFSTSRTIRLNPVGIDDDWLDPTRFNKVGGTPTDYHQILRWKIAVLGKLTGTTRDTCYIEANEFLSSNDVVFTVPPWIASGSITIRIRLCDCLQCDAQSGTSTCPFVGREVSPAQGTCVDTDIPCQLTAPEPGAVLGDNHGTTPRPSGSATDPGRRQP